MPANPIAQYPQSGGSLPTATGAGQTLVSTGAGNTYVAAGGVVLIQAFAASGAQASVTFASIPQTYTHLHLIIIGQIGAAGAQGVTVNFNGDVGSNYAYATTTNNAGAVTGASVTAQTAGNLGGIAGGGNSTIDVLIPGYASAFPKGYQSQNGISYVGTAAFYQSISGGWTGTAAVTSITVTSPSGNFTAGSLFSLYGYN